MGILELTKGKKIEQLRFEMHRDIMQKKKENGITTYRIAKVAGVTAPIVEKYIKNPQHNLKIDNLIKIAQAVDTHDDKKYRCHNPNTGSADYHGFSKQQIKFLKEFSKKSNLSL